MVVLAVAFWLRLGCVSCCVFWFLWLLWLLLLLLLLLLSLLFVVVVVDAGGGVFGGFCVACAPTLVLLLPNARCACACVCVCVGGRGSNIYTTYTCIMHMKSSPQNMLVCILTGLAFDLSIDFRNSASAEPYLPFLSPMII